MERLFIQLSDDVEISISKTMTLMTGFVVQGHTHYIYIYIYSGIYLLVEFSSIMGNVVFFAGN